MDLKKRALGIHRKLNGKFEIKSKVKIKPRNLDLVYTPGVAEASREIFKNKSRIFDYTIKKNSVAVVTDGSSVLGLGDIGPLAALPVMEGKCILFKEFADIDAFPICLKVNNTDEIVETVKRIAPVFGGINLEDIKAPECFEVEERLLNLGIPVMHDDQHGTAVVVFAALLNACKVMGKNIRDLKVVVNGAGAAGTAIAKLLTCHDFSGNICQGVKEVIVLDSNGIIHRGRKNLNKHKKRLARISNKKNISGNLINALENSDVFVGVSRGNILKERMIKNMAKKAVIFALANPNPEIMPDKALKAGAIIVATGRSDFPNQVNNALAFPGIFRGALNAKAKEINSVMKLSAAYALANCVKKPKANKLLPSLFDKKVVKNISSAIEKSKDN